MWVVLDSEWRLVTLEAGVRVFTCEDDAKATARDMADGTGRGIGVYRLKEVYYYAPRRGYLRGEP